MNPTEYQNAILKFANTSLSAPARLDNWSMGLMGECGEVIDLLKKFEYHGHTINTAKLIKEMGDVCFYLAIYCHDVGIDFDKVMAYRYPDGLPYPERLLTLSIATISRELFGFVHRLNASVEEIKSTKYDDHTWAMACFMSSAKGIYGVLTVMGVVYGIDMDNVLKENVAKLSARYPDGFSSELSINRSE